MAKPMIPESATIMTKQTFFCQPAKNDLQANDLFINWL